MKQKNKLIIFLITVFLGLTYLVLTKEMVFDTWFSSILYKNKYLDYYFLTITKFANVIPIILLLIILLFILPKNYKYKLSINVLLSISLGYILKLIIRRERPAVGLIKEKGFSYPSLHALISVAVYGFLIYYINRSIKNKLLKNILIIFLMLLIISIGFSRIYIGVHYFTDVVAGFILSTIVLRGVLYGKDDSN